MNYRLDIKEKAQEDLYRLAKNEPKAFEKAQRLIGDLEEHPQTGTSHPEPLKGKSGRLLESSNYEETSAGLPYFGDRSYRSCPNSLWSL